MDDNIVTEVPFNVLADKKNQFYVTDKMNLPNTAFRVAVSFGIKLLYNHVVSRCQVKASFSIGPGFELHPASLSKRNPNHPVIVD